MASMVNMPPRYCCSLEIALFLTKLMKTVCSSCFGIKDHSNKMYLIDKDFLNQSLICRKYCVEACEVPEPEDFFHIDQYSDIVTIAKPSIYISVQEIIDTHQVRIQAVKVLPEKCYNMSCR